MRQRVDAEQTRDSCPNGAGASCQGRDRYGVPGAALAEPRCRETFFPAWKRRVIYPYLNSASLYFFLTTSIIPDKLSTISAGEGRYFFMSLGKDGVTL
jgi:hypothetical protein